jgi:DNA-directed RNA polymerase subunit RPC12/RpoP
MWRCSKCGEEFEDQFERCWACGADRSAAQQVAGQASRATRKADERACAGKKGPLNFCPDCGAKLESGNRFCGHCGAGIEHQGSMADAEGSQRGVRCHYCQSEMDAEAIKCPRCGKYLREIEKDKGIYRVFGYSAVALGVLWLWVLLDNKYAFQTNSDFRTRMWILGIGCMVISCFSIPAWIRVGKRTGEWFWF